MSRVAARIELTEAERKELSGASERIARLIAIGPASQSDSVSERRFGESTDRGQTEVKSYGRGKWRERFSAERIAGLVDAPGRGRQSNLETEQMEQF